MTKIEDLRNYLLQRVPQLARNPEQLLTFIENGQVIYHNGDNYTHKYKMPARIVVTDWRGNPDDLVIAILEWITIREPGHNPETVLNFDAQVVDNEAIDIAFKLEVSETVLVTWNGETRTIEHVLPEPPAQINGGVDLEIFVSGPAYDFTLPNE